MREHVEHDRAGANCGQIQQRAVVDQRASRDDEVAESAEMAPPEAGGRGRCA